MGRVPWRARRAEPTTHRPVRLALGVVLVGTALFLSLRGYRTAAPEELRSRPVDARVHCDAPLYDVLDEGPPGGSLVSPERREALVLACDQTGTRLVLAALCLLVGGSLLWSAREDLAEELF